ncbi:putative secreted protein [Wickerhamomyces ciferrii]|uniref:Carboxypeptidase n=1 Tax=Wickerhamomyces ciferrii (strain ATCC 14091 / BCRC 22168 / CBS 111 / JCM 3599 / NBRC 0793 / NRRL Y-1031 F-60-10) TaxID=1206466 RepID=K0KN11_WICCF|nr:uncharacterized protein BN7_2288 [Wickerhamomyces ciferrii]CCH42744.1 putative secreted protein [Wickerhamomyces ciferrii]
MRLIPTAALVTSALAVSLNIPFINYEINLPQLSLQLSELSQIWGGSSQDQSNEIIEADVEDALYEILKTHSSNEIEQKFKEFDSKIPSSPRAKLQNIKQLDSSKYEFITNSKYPEHQLRINKADPKKLGIDTVNQTSGYLDFGDKHFFYYFFEARNNPETAPTLLWLNGGPGCSSMTGLFFELGPSSLGPDLKPIYNPYSWNNNANVIFLEQPIGVGFSYGDAKISTSYAAAKDVFVFLELFFQKFPQFVTNQFHIAGESYAGHYIPAIASEIVNHADRSFQLTSVLIGNGITDSLIQDAYYQPMACGLGGFKKVLSDEACDQMNKDYPKCKKLVEACYNLQNAFACVPATIYCSSKLLSPFEKTGLNFYDIRGPCETDADLCYNGMGYIEQYLNKPEVQEALGAEVQDFKGCDDDVFSSFALTGDESKPFQGFVKELLDQDIPVLIYAGDKDYICNWLGNRAWADGLDWKHGEKFAEKTLKPWIVNGTESGQVKSYGNFTFLRIYDAGHMVPYNQPEVSLDFVNNWLKGDYSLGY